MLAFSESKGGARFLALYADVAQSVPADMPIFQMPEGPEGKFPMQAGPEDLIKIPGQTRVDRDEYQEFLALGHGGIFDLDLNRSGSYICCHHAEPFEVASVFLYYYATRAMQSVPAN